MRWPQRWPPSTTASSVTLSTAHNSCNTLSSSTLSCFSYYLSLLRSQGCDSVSIHGQSRPSNEVVVRSHSPSADAFSFLCDDSCSTGVFILHGTFLVCLSFSLDALLRTMQLITQDLPTPIVPHFVIIFRLLHIHSSCQRTLLRGEAFSCMLVVYGFLLLGHMIWSKRCWLQVF